MALTLAPKDSATPITNEECTSLKNNTGLAVGDNKNNCEAFNSGLLPLIKQELDAIEHGNKPIFMNEDSKCQDGDPNPTIASMLSRIYRVAQAIVCNLCTYDPALVTRLKTGKANQILWGQGVNNLPLWKSLDTTVNKGSSNIATADAVAEAIQTVLLGTFHLWKGHENFDYYAESLDDLKEQSKTTPPFPNYAALISPTEVYVYDGATREWKKKEALKTPENFAITHINRGAYADKEIYFFFDPTKSVATWNVLDTNLGSVQRDVDTIKSMLNVAVSSGDGNQYIMMTKNTLAEAKAVPPTAGKTTIVLITEEDQ